MSVSIQDHMESRREKPQPREEVLVPETDISDLEYLNVICVNGMMFQITAEPKAIYEAVAQFHRGESFAIETRDGRILHYRNAQIISLAQQTQAHVTQENEAREEHERKQRFGVR